MDIGTILMIGGGGLQAISNWYGASQAIKQSKYQQDIYNSQARYIAATNLIEEEKIRRDVRKVISAQRAATAASGFQADTGTPLELQVATQMEGDLDIMLLRHAGSMQQLRLQTAGYAARGEGYGLASGLLARSATSSFDTLMSAGNRHGWFEKKPSYSSPGGLIKASQPQRLRWSNP